MPNLTIAGIGGQGVDSLAHVLGEVCHAAGLSCQYTVHKGGAQSLGSVYAEMRIDMNDHGYIGHAIPKGKLDLIVALDAWEALRHMPMAHRQSRAWVENKIMPLFTDRGSNAIQLLPFDQINKLPIELVYRDYQQDALNKSGTVKMANYLAGIDCLEALGISDVALYNKHFFHNIPQARAYRGVFTA